MQTPSTTPLTGATGVTGAAAPPLAPPAEAAGVATAGEAPGASVTLTPRAVEMAKQRLAKRGTPDASLRLGVRGGGCSGFNYVIEFYDGEPRARDLIFMFNGLRVLVDKKSILYLGGTVLEWEQTLMRQGFKFVNPHEATACGCGHSFTVK
ncbi:MAG: iron-sulfur cluster assembly accessory protein [Polyangiaceae bacterium]|jgi:iron-sulfur cluster assembly protein|nr:iron-sulfur cluster assembly accessory protein [Polyangiaceae bacterium]